MLANCTITIVAVVVVTTSVFLYWTPNGYVISARVVEMA